MTATAAFCRRCGATSMFRPIPRKTLAWMCRYCDQPERYPAIELRDFPPLTRKQLITVLFPRKERNAE